MGPTKPWSLQDSLRSVFSSSPRELLKRYAGLITFLAILALILAFMPSRTKTSPAGSFSAAAASAGNVGASGTTVGGYPCGPGKLQIPWLPYSPYCEPRFHGNNGGDTAPGVTGSTITLTYREANSSTINLLYQFVPKSVIGTNAQAEATFEAYISLFNRLYELYGRKVVFKHYVGTGDFLLEDLGQDTQAAQTDALTVADTYHAFADASFVSSSQVYEQDLANSHVIAFSFYENTKSFFESQEPYMYSVGPNCTQQAEAAAAIAAKSIYNRPSVDVGGALVGKPGTVAILHQNISSAQNCANETAALLQKEGVPVALNLSYVYNIANFGPEAQTDVAQLISKNVTFVICVQCDPISPRFFMSAASQAHYYPTWFFGNLFSFSCIALDAFGSLFPADQMVHTICPGFPTPSSDADNIALRALRMTGIAPSQISPIYPWIFAFLVEFYDALQSAGPDLTPQSFEQGLYNYRHDLPALTRSGMFGSWAFGPGRVNPWYNYEIMTYDPNAISPLDNVAAGVRGAYVPCNSGALYNYENFAPQLAPGTPLRCPKVS